MGAPDSTRGAATQTLMPTFDPMLALTRRDSRASSMDAGFDPTFDPMFAPTRWDRLTLETDTGLDPTLAERGAPTLARSGLLPAFAEMAWDGPDDLLPHFASPLFSGRRAVTIWSKPSSRDQSS